jgi:formylglycine-generating enzyme required for sulfatase activity
MPKLTIPLNIPPNCTPLQLKWVASGRFRMGDPDGLNLDDVFPGPMGEFDVIISKGFWLGIYPVTQCQWTAVMGNNPSEYVGANQPVEMISWTEVMQFCERLNKHVFPRPDNYVFTLPTEAQWEYTCRAGTNFKYQIGDALVDLSRVAWHRGNIPTLSTQPVGQKEPNHWGFYDMLGNVWEWCFDSPNEYPIGTTQVDWFSGIELSLTKNENRMLRGGCALMDPDNPALTYSYRMYGFEPHEFFGFRLCLRYHDPN